MCWRFAHRLSFTEPCCRAIIRSRLWVQVCCRWLYDCHLRSSGIPRPHHPALFMARDIHLQLHRRHSLQGRAVQVGLHRHEQAGGSATDSYQRRTQDRRQLPQRTRSHQTWRQEDCLRHGQKKEDNKAPQAGGSRWRECILRRHGPHARKLLLFHKRLVKKMEDYFLLLTQEILTS